jgi:hypothetical protein
MTSSGAGADGACGAGGSEDKARKSQLPPLPEKRGPYGVPGAESWCARL